MQNKLIKIFVRGDRSCRKASGMRGGLCFTLFSMDKTGLRTIEHKPSVCCVSQLAHEGFNQRESALMLCIRSLSCVEAQDTRRVVRPGGLG